MNVSLFDVSDMDAPKMIKRVAFGSSGLSEDFTILNLELPEDQDRIAKAFKVFPDGIVAVPFSGANAMYDSTTGCTNPQSGVQLVSWQNDTLAAKALLPMVGNPRRAIELTSEMLAVSDSNVTAFSIESASYGKKEADLTIGTCVDKSVPNQGAGGGGVNEGDQGGGYGYPADGYGGQGYDQAQSEPSSGSSGCGSVTLSKIGAAIASLRTSRR
jgi:hypothetical protein